jgi:hypothetical protein
MIVMRKLWSDHRFLEDIATRQAEGAPQPNGQAASALDTRSGAAGPAPAGSPAPAGKKGVSFDVYNPGDWSWDVILSNESLDTGSHGAGAIRRGTKCEDYEGWQDSPQTYTYKHNLLRLTFKMSARVRGRPKDDPDNNHFYVAEVRVSGEQAGPGLVSAQVEGARAIWDGPVNDLDHTPGAAAVTFTLVIRIKAGPLDGGNRTVRVQITVDGDMTWTQDRPSETPD